MSDDGSGENTSWLLKALLKEAKKDGVVSEDEKNVIEIIQRMLWDVEADMELLIEDDKSTEEMISALTKMLEGIFDEATKVANEDGKITDDEHHLLDTLKSFMATEGMNTLMAEFIAMFA